jgi:mono/diheme cytochrome c family protein
MKKSNVVIFVVFAIIFVLAIPFWAISGEGGADASPNAVPEADQDAKELFVANCGPCHTLAAAGTHGVVGPNLDDHLVLASGYSDANVEFVLNTIANGFQGKMPAGILGGAQAEEVADFVARYSGQ